MLNTSKGVAQGRFEQLDRQRSDILKRGREAAALTVPHLMPPQGHTSKSELPTPFQSIGARGVRNLASKLLLTLFPPHQPFFRYSIDDFAIEEIEKEAGEVGRGEIEKALNKRERTVMKEVEASFFRTAAFEAFRQLIVSGNVLLFVSPDDESVETYRLDKYVVKRDPKGTVLEIVLKQFFAPSSLPQNALAALGNKDGQGDEDTVALFTYIRRTRKGKYEVSQEIDGKVIAGTKKVYTEQLLPWKALRLTRIDGEDYGRGYIEEYLGDLISLEGLSQTVLEGSAVIAKVVTMVNPNGTTRARDISQAENGDVIAGNAEDVSMLQAEKRADLSVAQEQIGKLEQRLSFAFLLNTAIQRQGERVTAEEIRYMAQELEDGLGGMYSLMAQEFQLPMVYLFERRMELNKKVPKLPKDLTSPSVITGIDALGRGQDLRNLDGFLVGLGEQFGPDVIGRYIILSEAIKRRGVALGIDMNDLVRSEEDVQQAEEQAKLEALAQNLGPQAINALGNIQGKQQDNESKEAIAASKNKGE
jgi:hypothetical protein